MRLDSALHVRADDQLSELASLLATGLLRWHQQQRRLASENESESSPGGLEHRPETVLCVNSPVNRRERQDSGAPA